MLADAIIGFLAAFGIFCLLRSLRKAILCPVPRTENIKFGIVISVCGAAPELEATVRALSCMREGGRSTGDIVLVDRGMDPDTAMIAEKIANERGLKIIF